MQLSIYRRRAQRKMLNQTGQVTQRLWRRAPPEAQGRLRITADGMVCPERGHAQPRAIAKLDHPIGSTAFPAMSHDVKYPSD